MFTRSGLLIVGLIYLYGLVLGTLGLGWQWMIHDRLPNWNWWQFLLAPFAIGIVAASLEKVGEYLANGFSSNKTEQPKWKRKLGLFCLFLVMTALILAPAFYQIRHG